MLPTISPRCFSMRLSEVYSLITIYKLYLYNRDSILYLITSSKLSFLKFTNDYCQHFVSLLTGVELLSVHMFSIRNTLHCGIVSRKWSECYERHCSWLIVDFWGHYTLDTFTQSNEMACSKCGALRRK